MLGVFGLLISSVQTYMIEWEGLQQAEWTWASAATMVAYVVTLFVMYNLTSVRVPVS